MRHNLNRDIWLAFLIVAATSSPCWAQMVACSKPAIQRAASDVADSRRALVDLPLGELGRNAGVVPPGGAEAISRMKDRLNRLIVAYMACLPVQSEADPKRIQQELSGLAHAHKIRSGVNKNLPKDFGKYGFELWFDTRVTRDARRLISITATFDIECADDTILLVFSPGRTAWQEILRWQSPPYKEVSGAFWAFQYGISPDEAGKWYVATAYINGWCSSTWSMINYNVLRVSSVSSQPKVLLAKSDSIWWGNEDFGHLIVNRTDFQLRFDSNSIDAGVLVRKIIRRYAVKGDTVYRIPPVALSPRDFVDEWIVSPWSAARRWSATQDLQELQSMHDKISKLESDPATDFSYGAFQHCTNSTRTFQITLCPEKGGAFYFRVKSGPFFRMIDVKETPDPDCTGRNLSSEK